LLLLTRFGGSLRTSRSRNVPRWGFRGMVQVPMLRTCTVRLLGGFLVEVDGRRVPSEAWRHRRGADLVKRLALAPLHRLHREQLMEGLWPDLGAEAAAANLRKAIYYARRSLGGKEAIGADGDVLALWPGGRLSIDAERVEAQAAQALATGNGLDAAAELFTGDLLPEDRYVEWIESHRERLRNRRLEVLKAAGRWEKVLELDRADERAHRALMQSHLTGGDRQAAIRQFQRLREVLRVDLGVAPEPETVALFEQAVAIKGPQPASPAERAQALLARGLLHWNHRDLDAAEQLADQARELATQHHLGRELGEASALLGMVAFARGHWPERFRQEFMKALRLGFDQASFVMDAQLCLVEASLTAAESEPTTRLAHELLPLAVDAGSQPGEALMSLVIGESEMFSGRLDESNEWLSRAAGLYQDMHWDSGRAVALVRLAEVALARNRAEEASGYLTTARPLAERSELVSHLLVRVFAGMVEAAHEPELRHRLLGEADEALRPKEVCGPCSIGFRVAAAIACARSGELARSRRELADAERIAGMWQGGPWQAAVWEARAALRHAEGHHSQAAALLREAANLFAESGRPLDLARCIGAGVAATGG
jgi:DNA-binding SARP family transcriptional activator